MLRPYAQPPRVPRPSRNCWYRESMDALVLSAAGMFGAWQAGAWTALAPRFRPAAVVGTSAGALNGWAIAGGIDPAQLVQYWEDPRMSGIMRPRLSFSPWRGLFAPKVLEDLARELFESYRPRIPFAATLAEVPRLRPVLVRAEEMTWRHLLASCSIPLGFPPVRIGNRYYVDGGLLGVLPLWAAAELGASRALAVDALPRMPSRLVRGAALAAQRVALRPPGKVPGQVIHLVPSGRLGGVRQALTWEPAAVRRWIEQGARDAECLVTRRGSDGPGIFD